MNIVFATDQYWPSISGVSVSVDAFRKQFTKMGHQVYTLVPDYPEAPLFDEKINTANLYRFRSYKIFFNDENRLVHNSEKKKIFALLDNIKPDIIHVHTEFAMGKIATSYAKKKAIPLVMTAHTNWEELIHHYVPIIPANIARLYCRARMRRTYNRSNTLIVPTSLMEVLLNLYFVKRPIRVIPTGIDKSIFQVTDSLDILRKKAIEKCPQIENKKILFFAGRMGKEKNITFLIDVLKELLQKHPKLMLVISGDGPAKKELQQYALNKGVSDNVIFTGFVERQHLRTLYSIADVFVFASKVESQGMVALEAMACGTPVVAIGKMGTREVMGGDSGGFMVDDELELFVERVDELLTNPELRQLKSEEALKHVEKWTIEIEAAKMFKLYQSLIKKNGVSHTC